MSVFRGLFVRKDATRGTTPVEARKSLAALFHRHADGSPRQGVLTALQVTGTSGWQYSVPAGGWVTSRGIGDGVVLSGNDGPQLVDTTPAPATGSRIDVIYVQNRDVDAGDADSAAVIGVENGVASGTPVAPEIPAGAMELARATVTAGNANTLDATITQTAPVTGLAGADLVVPFGLSSFDTRISSPVEGLRVRSTTEGRVYVRSGTTWRLWATPPTAWSPTAAAGWSVGDASVSGTYTINEGLCSVMGAITIGSTTTFAQSHMQVGLPVPAATDAATMWFGGGHYFISGTSAYDVSAYAASSNALLRFPQTGGALYGTLPSSVITPADGHVIRFTVSYPV